MRLTPRSTTTDQTRPTRTGRHHAAGTAKARRYRRLLAPAGAVLLALALVMLAASPAGADSGVRVVALAGSVDEVLGNLRTWLMGILAGLATVFLTVGGVRYVMAGGDPGEIERAKAAFKSAGWGYVGAALAPLVVTVLRGLVGA